MIDIVFPNKNEEEFIQIAEKLGYKALILVYPKKTNLPQVKTKLKLYPVTPKKGIIKIARSSDRDRHYLEKTDLDIIYALESHERKDRIHQRDSAFNQILAKIAQRKKKMIAFSFNSVLNSEGMKRSQIIGRMMQNIMLCRKYKIKTVIASFATKPYEMRDPNDLIAFGITLGMHPKEAKDSLNNAYERIKENQKKKSASYITEGVEIVDG